MTALMEFETQAYKKYLQENREYLASTFPEHFKLKLVVSHDRPNGKKQLKKAQKEQLKNWRNQW